MDVTGWSVTAVAIILMIVGILGTVVPVIPGLPLIWLTILAYGFVDQFQRIDSGFLSLTLFVVIIAEIADYLARAWGARRFGAGKPGVWGAVIGSFIGLFFLPVGLILGPFLGAFIGELMSGRTPADSLRAGWGGLVGTLGSIVVKMIVGVGIIIAFIARVLNNF